MSPRALAECGTPGAYRRHKRLGEAVDQQCLDAEAKRSVERGAQARDQAARDAVSIVRDGDRLTFSVSLSDGRDVAASVLDRSLTMRSWARTQAGDAAKADRLKSLHKRIVTELRAAGVLS